MQRAMIGVLGVLTAGVALPVVAQVTAEQLAAAERQMLTKDNVINTVVRPPFPQPAYPAVALPMATFTDRMQLHFNGETLDLVHVGPAHTTGDAAVIFRGHPADWDMRYGDPTRGYAALTR